MASLGSKPVTPAKNVNYISGIAIGTLIVMLMLLALFIGIISSYNIIQLISSNKLFLEKYTNSSIGLIFDYIIIGLLLVLAVVIYKM